MRKDDIKEVYTRIKKGNRKAYKGNVIVNA